MYLITESGLNDKAPYDPTLLAFFHQGVEIRNPYLSPCGGYEVDPVAVYGFGEVWTGGDCRALDLTLPDGCVLRLTNEDGLRTPDPNEWESAIIGRLSSDHDEIAWCVLGEVPLTTDR
ncbi:hypothetical protein [Azotobacter beijerinckii]|uniref:Uncharacterized protein n=1 Tax=Azotobacter beijerinckii TaxID=170623 RepID=A0A1I4FUT4_9GAMM|nr:hypothetical protein [Azotobacter beijerinckii]SFB62783.1 hypothetical protein SAMN04244571_04450 [Azotobacter beijerinckii]SFL21189.1 hypothetical protein SAMN04244574_03543 [Azotobacter beijerinckii]